MRNDFFAELMESLRNVRKNISDKLKPKMKYANVQKKEDIPDNGFKEDVGSDTETKQDLEFASPSIDNELRIIKQIMLFYDKQMIKLDYAKAESSENNDFAEKLINSTIRELTRTLSKLDVEIINTPHKAVGAEDDIVDSEETDFAELVGKIASVVRVGYSYRGELQRAQEVIVYKEGEKV